jgi:cell division protein FtsB
MTVLGKTLAILNLVLSLFVGWLIVVSYVTRTNWHAAYTEIDKQVKAAQADANTYRDEANDAKGKVKSLTDDVRALNEKMKSNEEVAAARVQELTRKYEGELAKNKVVQQTSGGLTSETGRRQNEVEYLKGLTGSLQDKVKSMEKQVEDSRAAAVEAQIAANSEHERNNNLLNQNEKLTKDLQKAQQNGGATLTGNSLARTNPPAEDVEGVIKAADPQSGYVTISIGSDAGIQKGNTLEVYRLRPEPAYLGRIEILAVHANEAVAKPVVRLRGQIQVGDRVSSSIVGRRG